MKGGLQFRVIDGVVYLRGEIVKNAAFDARLTEVALLPEYAWPGTTVRAVYAHDPHEDCAILIGSIDKGGRVRVGVAGKGKAWANYFNLSCFVPYLASWR